MKHCSNMLIVEWSTVMQKAKLENGYDPGKCNQSNHATFIVVKDRENNDRLLICAEENDVYNWKTTDGEFQWVFM